MASSAPTPLHSGAAKAREAEVRADLIRSIYGHIPRSALGVLAGALTVTWGMWGQVAQSAMLAWLAAITAVLLWRLSLYRAFKRADNVTQRVSAWERYWILSTAVHGSVWGSSAFFMYVPGSPEHQALLLVALFALSTAAVPLIGRNLASLYAFVITVLGPIIVRLALEGGAMRILLAIISALVVYGIVLFGRELNRTITESVRRGYENVELIEQLTDQKARAEAARAEADQANRMKTRFLAAASHDLRQPMHALGLFSDTLKRRITDPEQQAIAAHICQSVEALERTFDALLDISRLDAGIVQPRRETFALAPLFARVAGECAPEAFAKGIALRVHATKLATRSDPVLVEQVLRNLVNNALRYTDHGKVLIGCRARGRFLRVGVWDTGVGIPEDKHSRIFDEFYQADERDRRKGLGLGLAIVRRVANLLSIKIELRSCVGRGSVFGFELPRCEAAAGTDPRPMQPPAPVAAPRRDAVVLVIDDDATVLEAMREALQSWGVRVVAARSLACALAQLPECGRYPDAMISDYRLGDDSSGIDAIVRIRHELGVAVPAMLITGDTAPKNLRVIQASGYPYLSKPVIAERLREQLAALLEQRSAAPPQAAETHSA